MALTFGVAELIFSYIHDKAGDRADGCIRACTCAGPVLLFLIVRFPPQAETQTSLTTLLGELCQSVHLVLFHTATYGESTVCHQRGRQCRQYRHLSKLPATL